jgi:hypothetical protein
VPASSFPGGQVPSNPVLSGKAVLIEGDVRILDRRLQSRRPRVGDLLYEGDSIVTGRDGEAHFEMEDGGYIGVRPNTKMRIANFKAEGGPDDTSVFGLLEGSFRSVTGWIGKLGGNRYQINTPTATLGVRGTDHEPKVIPAGSTEGDPGTYDRVYIGETQMQTSRGIVTIRPNQAGFVAHGGATAPRVLGRIPDHYRSTRNEQRFRDLHNRIQPVLDQRREQRIRELRQQNSTQGVTRDQGKVTNKDAQEKAERRREQLQKQQQERKQQFEQKQTATEQRQQQERQQRIEQRKLANEQRQQQETQRRQQAEQRRESLRKQQQERRDQADQRQPAQKQRVRERER